MRIVNPSATLMEHNVHPYEFIERVGRTCYKSENLITEGSAERFVAGLIKSQHMAMLEHETIYMTLSLDLMLDLVDDMDLQNEQLKYFNISLVHASRFSFYVLSGSFRSFYELFSKNYESGALEHIKGVLKSIYPLVFGGFEDNHKKYTLLEKVERLLSKDKLLSNRTYPKNSCAVYFRDEFEETFEHIPEVLFKHLTHTFKFVCDRGVTHEFVRHRPASYAQESTRYCNYAKDKFGNEISVILPCGLDGTMIPAWQYSCEVSEKEYFRLLELGASPQMARSVLPTSLKTELIVTATESEWQHIVNLRCLGTTGAPHPQIREVMRLAEKDLINTTNHRVKYGDYK